MTNTKQGMESKRIYLSPPHMGSAERELLLDAFDSNWIAPLGPHVDGFERELSRTIGEVDVAVLSSGTAALHLALLILGVGSGDEVYVSTLTFSATANAVRYVGADPVFIDSDFDSWNISPDLLEEELKRAAAAGRLPKAVIAVDLYGQCANYSRIVEMCKRFDVPLIEDAAEALGATYDGRNAATFGDIAVLSFNGNKIITTSGGGALVSHDPRWTQRARFLSTQARDAAPHYQHSHVGYNYRMSNLLAAVGRGQLGTLTERVNARRAIFERYRAALGALPGLKFMPEPAACRSTRWLTALTINSEEFGADREQVRTLLDSMNIEARPVWKPMHLQPVFSANRVVGGSVSEAIFRDGLCLPSGSSLTHEDQLRVIELVRSASAVTR